MSKSKERKYELGKSRPTENRAYNSIVNQQVNEWVEKIREAGKHINGEGVNSSINRVANVLTELIVETKRGKYPREVISGVIERCNVAASLVIAQHTIERGIRNVLGKRD